MDGDGGSELRGRPHPCSTFHRNYTLKDTYYIVELATLCTVVHIISSFFCYTYLLSGQLSLWTFRIWEGVGRTNVTTVDRGSKKSEILRTSQMDDLTRVWNYAFVGEKNTVADLRKSQLKQNPALEVRELQCVLLLGFLLYFCNTKSEDTKFLLHGCLNQRPADVNPVA